MNETLENLMKVKADYEDANCKIKGDLKGNVFMENEFEELKEEYTQAIINAITVLAVTLSEIQKNEATA